MQLARFISIEGGEGAGKTTVMKFVEERIQKAGHAVTMTREPGGTPLSEKIRQLLLHPSADEKIAAETELLLMFGARSQHLHQCIIPALNAGKWVVSDRYVDASYAYQGGGRGINLHFIADLDRHVVGKYYPDLTLLLDLPPEIGFARAAHREQGKDRIESEQIDFFKRVRDVYLQRAFEDPRRIKVIDASKSQEEVQAQVAIALEPLMLSKIR